MKNLVLILTYLFSLAVFGQISIADFEKEEIKAAELDQYKIQLETQLNMRKSLEAQLRTIPSEEQIKLNLKKIESLKNAKTTDPDPY